MTIENVKYEAVTIVMHTERLLVLLRVPHLGDDGKESCRSSAGDKDACHCVDALDKGRYRDDNVSEFVRPFLGSCHRKIKLGDADTREAR